MSTPCRIGKINANKTVESIYCHWDGYPSYIAPILLGSYNTKEKVEELLALGDISVLAKNIAPKTDAHALDNPEEDVVIAYHRDRGDELTPAKLHKTKSEMQQQWSSHSYLYDIETDRWFYARGEAYTPLKELKDK